MYIDVNFFSQAIILWLLAIEICFAMKCVLAEANFMANNNNRLDYTHTHTHSFTSTFTEMS